MPPRMIAMPPTATETIRLVGGLDEITPTLLGKAGWLKDGLNFECVEDPGGGYRRIHGYDQTDGRQLASTMFPTFLTVTTPNGATLLAQAANAAVTQAGGFTAKLVKASLIEGTTYLVVIRDLSAAVHPTRALTVGVTNVGEPSLTVPTMPDRDRLGINVLSQNQVRAERSGAPGSGPIRGAFQFESTRYCLRDDADGTAQVLHMGSGQGWVPVPLFREIAFTNGGAIAPLDELTLVQGGKNATIKRVVTEAGRWTDSNASGRFLITTPNNEFASGAASIVIGSTTVTVTLVGPSAPIALAPGGHWVWFLHNFRGSAHTLRMYGCDNRNRMMEFDGTVLVPIKSALIVDIPSLITAFQNHLFYANGSSVFCSGIGDPYRHTETDGAAQYAMGDIVTGMESQKGEQSGSALLIGTRTTTHLLYGTSSLNFAAAPFQSEVGAVHGSMERLDRTYFFNELGFYDVAAAFQYGNFRQSALSNAVKRFLGAHLGLLVDACVNRNKNQYRAFFSDGMALYVTLVNGKLIGYAKQKFPRRFSVVWNGFNDNGREVTLAGDAENGKVYLLDVGASFNGEPISAFFKLWDDTARSPRTKKTYRRMTVYLAGTTCAYVRMSYTLGYGRGAQPGTEQEVECALRGVPVWGTPSMVWGRFVWGGKDLDPAEFTAPGEAEAISYIIRSGEAWIDPYVIQNITYDYTPRRGLRG